MNIAIISSARKEVPEELLPRIQRLADIIANSNLEGITILTGGCHGILAEVNKRCKASGLRTVCYSPDKDTESHNAREDNNHSSEFDEIRYHSGFTMRSLAMGLASDCVLALNGRMGTLSEFTIALEEGKKVAVLTNTGGISDHLEDILALTEKSFPNQVFFSNDEAECVQWLLTK